MGALGFDYIWRKKLGELGFHWVCNWSIFGVRLKLTVDNTLLKYNREEAEDFEVIEAGIQESGRTFIPTNDNLSSQPGFKLLSQEDLAREESQDDVIIVEVGEGAEEQARLLDIPRDTSGADQPFFKLPLPDEAEEDEYDDVVIIAASDEVS